MKKIISILFIVVFSVALYACGTTEKTTTTEETTTTAEQTTTTVADTTTTTEEASTTTTTEAETTTTAIDQSPTITGTDAVTIETGDTFDPRAGITASDNEDGDLTNEIIVLGTVDTTLADTYTLRYKVTDSAGNVTIQMRSVTVTYVNTSGDMIGNGDFAQKTNGWNLSLFEGALGTISTVNEELKLEITAVSGNPALPRIDSYPFALVQGKTYQVTFEARADEARNFHFQVGKLLSAAPWFEKFDTEQGTKVLSTEMQTYTYKFTMVKPSNDAAQLLFEFGTIDSEAVATNVYIDNVAITETTPDPDVTAPTLSGVDDKEIKLGSTFNPLDGVTILDDQDYTLTVEDIVLSGDTVTPDVVGTYTLVYTITDASGNTEEYTRVITVKDVSYVDTDYITNGDFTSTDLTGWDVYKEGADFTFTVENGELKVDKTVDGGDLWRGQLFFAPVNFVEGKYYRFVFDVKADADTTINAVIGDQLSADPWFISYTSESINVTTSYVTHEVIFKMTADTLNEGRVKFELGAGAYTTLYFDNVKIQEEGIVPVIANGTFDDATGWKTYMNDTNADAIVENGEAVYEITQVGAESYSNQLFMENLKLDANTTYSVSFDARALEGRPMIIMVQDPGNGYAVIHEEKVTLTTDMDTYTYTFTTGDAGTTTAKFGFFLGNIDGTTVVTTAYIDNVVFVPAG